MRLKIYLEIDAMKNRGFDFGDFEITKREILATALSVPAVKNQAWSVGLKTRSPLLAVEKSRTEKTESGIMVVLAMRAH